MHQSTKQRPIRIYRATVFVTALMLLALLLVAIRPAHADDAPDIRVTGAIVTAPESEDGVGVWTIEGRAEGGTEMQVWTVIANPETDFPDGVLTVGDLAKVVGVLTGDGAIDAEKIERAEHGGGHGDDLEGVVLTAPAGGDGIGDWTMQTDREQVLTVTADINTAFVDGVPLVGDWIEVRGQPRPDGSILATRIKLDEYENSELVVRLQSGAISATVASRYSLNAHSTLLSSGDIYLFTSEDEIDDMPGLVAQLNQDSEIIWAELNYVGGAPVGDPYRTWGWGGTEPTDYVNQAAFDQINLTAVGDQYPGDGVIIAMLDTGIDLDHPVFSGRILTGIDLIDDDNVPDEVGNGLGWGHGTHTSGIVAEVAPGAQLLPVRVLDTNARGNTFLLAYAIEWSVGQGADVINLSLGTPHDSYVLRDAIDAARQQGVIIVAAVGNDNQDHPQYPAAYPGVLAVTAVDGENVKADFANYGRAWVDIAAPGVGVTSTIIGPQGSGYAVWSGTSMAAPFVTGAAARLRDRSPNAQAESLRHKLLATVRDIDAQNPNHVDQLGGLLDVAAALDITEAPAAADRLYLPIVVK